MPRILAVMMALAYLDRRETILLQKLGSRMKKLYISKTPYR